MELEEEENGKIRSLTIPSVSCIYRDGYMAKPEASKS